jgi:septal ring factor EnvC (AmiA/AmiB activator)
MSAIWAAFQQPTTPFFSNDWAGIAKVAGLVGVICGFIWRSMNAPFKAALADHKADTERRFADLNKEVETTKSRRDVVDARLNTLERDALVMNTNLRGLDESFGEVSQKLERVIDRIDRKDDGTALELRKLGERMASIESLLRGSAKDSGS